MAAGGDRGQRQHRGRAGRLGDAAGSQHDRREQQRGHGQAGISGESERKISVQRPGADPAARMRGIRERRDERASTAAAPIPIVTAIAGGRLATAAVGKQPAARLAARLRAKRCRRRLRRTRSARRRTSHQATRATSRRRRAGRPARTRPRPARPLGRRTSTSPAPCARRRRIPCATVTRRPRARDGEAASTRVAFSRHS